MQRGMTSQGLPAVADSDTVLPEQVVLAAGQRQQAVVSQMVMIGYIFITQRQTPHADGAEPPTDVQLGLHSGGLEAGRCLTDDVELLIHFAQEQGVTVAGDTSIIKALCCSLQSMAELKQLLDDAEVAFGMRLTVIGHQGRLHAGHDSLIGDGHNSHQRLPACALGFGAECVAHCRWQVNHRLKARPVPLLTRCWKGLREIAVPIRWQGLHLGTLYAGTWRTQRLNQAGRLAAGLAESAGLGSDPGGTVDLGAVDFRRWFRPGHQPCPGKYRGW